MGTPTYSASNKTIAKNTLMLYIRMFLSMVVGLYTSRVVLSTLGVSDFGVYNAVGGVVGMFSFLQSALSGATSRFIAYELGHGNEDNLSKTFNSAFIVHVGIALLVFSFTETVGIWVLNHKIVIPVGRESAAKVILQASMFTGILSTLNVPFNACIIAHERMSFYAYIELLHVFLKLLIVFLLPILPFDKLKSYSILLMLTSVLIIVINNTFCRHNFKECHLRNNPDKTIMKEMISFSLYNLFGNFGSMVNRQGIVILINNFFGVVANAASGLATTAANVISSFANNIITAFRPPITKSYSSGNYSDVEKLSLLAFLLSTYLFSLFAVPAGIEMEKLMDLWQKEHVPDNTVLFTRIILLCTYFGILRYIATITIHATGRVKIMSLFNGLVLTCNPVLIYCCFKFSAPAHTAYLCYLCANISLFIISVCLMTHYVGSISRGRIFGTIFKGIVCGVITCVITYVIIYQMPSSFGRIILTTVISSIILTVLFGGLCLNQTQRIMVWGMLLKRIGR